MAEIDGLRIILSSLIDTVDEMARAFEHDDRNMSNLHRHLHELREHVWAEGRP
jgi:hypothetical protein